MNNLERKALELVNGQAHGSDCQVRVLNDASKFDLGQALLRAIEQHEAFRQELSDVIKAVVHSTYIPTPARHKLERFIIAKPDPLVEAMHDCGVDRFESWADQLRAALAKRGLEIREKKR